MYMHESPEFQKQTLFLVEYTKLDEGIPTALESVIEANFCSEKTEYVLKEH